MIPATITSIDQESDTVYTFWFKPAQPIEYTAGQFIEISLPHDADERGIHRWFTLSSSPTEPLLAITTRKATRPSSFKRLLFTLQPGDTISISQAMGDFVLPMQKSIPVIFLIRGIGITPVRSMLKALEDTHEPRQISVIYSATDQEDLLFHDLTSSANSLQTHLLSSNIDTDTPVQSALEHIKKAPDSRIYISGPEQFVEAVYEKLRMSGIKPFALVTDYFHGYEG